MVSQPEKGLGIEAAERFSRNIENGRGANGKANKALKDFNDAIRKQRADYIAVNPEPRGFKKQRTRSQIISHGDWYMRHSGRFGAAAIASFGLGAIGGFIGDFAHAASVVEKSRNFQEGIMALKDGRLDKADEYFLDGLENLTQDLRDEGLHVSAGDFDQYWRQKSAEITDKVRTVEEKIRSGK